MIVPRQLDDERVFMRHDERPDFILRMLLLLLIPEMQGRDRFGHVILEGGEDGSSGSVDPRQVEDVWIARLEEWNRVQLIRGSFLER